MLVAAAADVMQALHLVGLVAAALAALAEYLQIMVRLTLAAAAAAWAEMEMVVLGRHRVAMVVQA